MSEGRIYLDNAATSWPKPNAVYEAVDHYQRTLGAPAGRGVYREAVEVERLVAETRRRAAELLGVADSSRIVFTGNGTDSLNIAIHGLLRKGDHVITTVTEHNSVLRPLRTLERENRISVSRIRCDGQGFIDPADFAAALKPQTRLFVLGHVSNVSGAIQPIEEVGRIAREHGAFYLIDAAQSLGHLPLSVRNCQADFVAAPGHKGLLGPLGCGVLYLGERTDGHLTTIRQGGTGTASETDQQPDSLPDRFESGNLNVPAIIGLGAGLKFLSQKAAREASSKETPTQGNILTRQICEGLRSIPGVRMYGPNSAGNRLGVVSISVAGYDSREVAALLDSVHYVQTRPGIHCAPLMHQAFNTLQTGGLVRLSVGHFSSADDVNTAVDAVAELAASSL